MTPDESIIWLCPCPYGHPGIVRPLVTKCGCIVLFCDEAGEVWLRPDHVKTTQAYTPAEPDWTVVCCISIEPGTTRYADESDLEELDWDVEWRRGV